MLKSLSLAAFVLGLAGPLCAGALDGKQTYDLLFRQGTLDQVALGDTLRYARTVTNTLKPEAAERDSGDIVLTLEQDKVPMVALELQQDVKHRSLGAFPASVGNPMIMYFYESVVRDMAEAAGGSPFYIRNRVKDALIQPTEVIEGTAEVNGAVVPTQTVVLHPFKDDPNGPRMMGFDKLELTVVMSDAVPGWYQSLSANVPGEGDVPVYHSEIGFEALGAAQ